MFLNIGGEKSTLRLPGMKFGVCLLPELRPRGSGLILNGALNPDLKIGFGAVERINIRWAILKDYLLRIYRREKNDPRILVGVAEEVGVEGIKAFSNLDELWPILNPSKAGAAKTVKLNKHNRLNKPDKPER